ncbi:DUF4307 domain-containing protein [Microbacterium sp. LRZ72]|uniref:DUF4307 domain-containing protein n=1 Tax=Microbacterium sp. LRZ72 TaxID=2942481 RepID=UPI0029A95C66|nr:DUF4307 domain-containing protein [Microbacterium sp. LRZ72]MDX2375811.1 DUF4307 domain-containing protein [Microbacterium sp. LRZ72]
MTASSPAPPPLSARSRAEPSRLDLRYGRTPQRRRVRVIAGVAAITVAAVVVGWFALATSQGSVRADDLGYEVTDERSVEVAFQTSGPADRAIACAVEALDEEFGVVGWRVFVYPPNGETTRSFRESVPTVALATTGLVNACWVA